MSLDLQGISIELMINLSDVFAIIMVSQSLIVLNLCVQESVTQRRRLTPG